MAASFRRAVYLVCALHQVSSAELDIHPRYLHVNKETTSEASILCTLREPSGSGLPLAGCEFRRESNKRTWVLTGPGSVHRDSDKSYVRYHGAGLHSGECGITLVGLRWGDRSVLGCRVRTTDGSGWQYATMLLRVTDWLPMQFSLQPRVALALPGTNVTLSGEAEYEFDEQCSFKVPSSSGRRISIHSSLMPSSSSEASFTGTGRDRKTCGVTLLHVQPASSGFVLAWVAKTSHYSLEPHRSAVDFAELIVAEAPEGPPVLTLNTPLSTLAEGSTLSATCVVTNSRPVANITWLLGGHVIREDRLNEAPPEDSWRWDHEPQTIVQHLSYTLTSLDDGKRLRCRAQHVAIPAGTWLSQAFHIQL